MKIQVINDFVLADYNEVQVDNNIVNKIAENTVETWQPDRKNMEKGSNTRQGKIAEEILEAYVEKGLRGVISLKSYDVIRNDNFEKHAPFDLLLWESGKVDDGSIKEIEESIRTDITNTPSKFVKLSAYTRKLCREKNVLIAEVKSTKIKDDLKKQAKFSDNYDAVEMVAQLADEIKRRHDVFCYPHYKRSEKDPNYSISDYCQHVKACEPSLFNYEGEELRKHVIDMELEKQCCDIFIRVYVDPAVKKGIIIGWMQRERLLDYSVNFKRMFQKNKSELALYFAKNLSETESIKNLARAFEGGAINEVYASPYTSSAFYHKRIDCRFLSRVGRDEIIVFDNEADAIANGRYTQRCKNCFD